MSHVSAHFRLTLLIFVGLAASLLGQSQTSQTTAAAVPAMVRFSGTVNGASGRMIGLTFALYRDQQDGAPLWLETQSVPVDAAGHYNVQVGATLSKGLPKELFASGEARWLGVQAEGQAEQPRVLLLSVPYALKAADAETLGGLPLSAFVLAAPAISGTTATVSSPAPTTAPVNPSVTGVGTVGTLPLWDSSSDILSSVVTQTGSGSTAHIGINTTTPSSTLDVKGGGTFRGALGVTSSGAATTTAGKPSFPFLFTAAAFNSGTATSVTQTFRWQAEPISNNTANATGKLSLLFSSGTNAATETGLGIASNGQMTFAAGQTFPGAGTITGVTAGGGLTGGGTSGSVSLSVPPAGITNAMLRNPDLTLTAGGGLAGGGSVALGGSTSLGLKTCAANQILQFVSSAWTCANLSSGTITGVTAGVDLTGGGSSGAVTLNLDTTKVPQLNSPNSFVGNQIINGILSLDANANTLLNVVATNSGPHSPMASFGSGGSATTDANSIRVYNGGLKVGPYTDVFIAAPGTFIPGTLAGDGGLRVAPGQNIWFGDAKAARVLIDPQGDLSVAGSIFANPSAPGFDVLDGTGASDPSSGGNGAFGVDVQGGDGDTTAGSGGEGGFGVAGFGGAGDQGTPGGVFFGGTGTEAAGYGLIAVPGSGPNSLAAEFDGDVTVTGTISTSTPNLKIDHPLDPANKYLNHASIASSEMLNVYSGNVVVDAGGQAEVQLPDWFEAANCDFRYQLTSIGAPGPNLHIAEKIANHRFKIAGGQPGTEVSWQVTGVRQDAYAQAHPLVVEQSKSGREQGHYLHPELYGATAGQSVSEARNPRMRARLQAKRNARARLQDGARQPASTGVAVPD